MELFKSVKFWTAVGAVVAIVASQYIGIGEDKVNQIVAVLVSFILGRGLGDVAAAVKK